MAMIIDGAALAKQIREQVKARTAELAAKGKAVHLTAILVGSTAAGELYAQRQKETCAARLTSWKGKCRAPSQVQKVLPIKARPSSDSVDKRSDSQKRAYDGSNVVSTPS